MENTNMTEIVTSPEMKESGTMHGGLGITEDRRDELTKKIKETLAVADDYISGLQTLKSECKNLNELLWITFVIGVNSNRASSQMAQLMELMGGG